MSLAGAALIDLKTIGDSRGFFCELWRERDFYERTGVAEWKQANWSRSEQGVLRGLHFQKGEHAQAKAVWVVRGQVFDVCVDLRGDSPDFGRAAAFELSGDKPQILFIPEGFAHGFCVVSESADFMYRCSEEYHAAAEGGLRWNDPALKIPWPSLGAVEYKLSERDRKWPDLHQQEKTLRQMPWR